MSDATYNIMQGIGYRLMEIKKQTHTTYWFAWICFYRAERI